MAVFGDLQTEFNSFVGANGQLCVFRYFSSSLGAGSYFDDDATLTKSGTDTWVSGLVLPGPGRASSDVVLTSRGNLADADCRLYVGGAVSTSGTWRVGLGSPVEGWFGLKGDGVEHYPAVGTVVYKKCFLRHLPTGSLMGE